MIFLSLSSILLLGEGIVVPDDYTIADDTKLSYVYSDEYTHIVPALKSYQTKVMTQFEEEFGYAFDTRMYVGLASLNNQIANGMATPIPFNSQLYYGAGSSMIDYFTSKSWLKTLAIHETAHNYQLHAREKNSSRFLYKIFGNTFVDFFGFPLDTLPTTTESNFILEGNAVMNESRFGNGGRLYSGYALASVVSLAHAGEITPALMFNPVMKFPYGSRLYLVGGFYQKFLAEKYGVKKTNAYFKTLSGSIFTLCTNDNHEKHFGKSFESLLAEFSQYMQSKHKGFHKTQGKLMGKSQIFIPLNSDKDEIVTVVSDLKSPNKVMKIDKHNAKVSYKEGYWRAGKVFKFNNTYFTQTSAKINANKIEIGLYDERLNQKKNSGSKVLQGVLPDGKEVYFDVVASIDQPQITIEGQFYDTVHSSVYVSQAGDLYYFKQEGQKRTLYKNKKSLHSFQGHYGYVTEVNDSNHIYFIAKSAHGSTAYMYDGTKTKRVTTGDDVIDFKLLNNAEALVATIDAEGIEYHQVTIENIAQSVTATSYSLEDKSSPITVHTQNLHSEKTLISKPYSTLGELKYSYSEQSIKYNEENGLMYNTKIHFYDPLMRNNLNLFLHYEKKRQMFGLGYQNRTSLLEYGGSIFGINEENMDADEQEYAYNAYMQYPFLNRGYWDGNVRLSHSTDANAIYREMSTLSLNISNMKHFGYSKLPNSLNAFNAFVSQDTDALYYGASYTLKHDIGWQTNIGLDMKYLKSDSIDIDKKQGIYISDSDAQLSIPSLSGDLYVKEAKSLSVSLHKTFDTPLYFFTFPLSMHRNTLYAKQSYHDLDLGTDTLQYNETTFGIETDLLVLNAYNVNIYVEMILNDDVKDNQQIRWGLSQGF